MKWIGKIYVWGREMLVWFRTFGEALYKTKLKKADGQGLTGKFPFQS